MTTPSPTLPHVGLMQLFGIFAKIGAFTLGGGYAMIPLIENEMSRRKWIADNELDDIVVLAQSAPGLLAVNMAIYTGHHLRGLKGSVAATLGAVVPSFLVILPIAIFFTSFRNSPLVDSIFQALRPVAIALILVPAVRMAAKNGGNILHWAISIVTLVLVAILKVSPILILLVLITFSLSLGATKKRNR